MVSIEKKCVLKYIGVFLIFTILLHLVMLLIAIFDQDRLELIDCYSFKYGQIIEEFDYQSYLQGHCVINEMCACSETSEWILIFYIYSLPIFVFYEFFRRKIVLAKYSYLCILGEIMVWTLIWYINQHNAPYTWFIIHNVYRFIAPLAIIMLTLYILPSNILKVVSIIIGAPYLIAVLFFISIVISNIFTLW